MLLLQIIILQSLPFKNGLMIYAFHIGAGFFKWKTVSESQSRFEHINLITHHTVIDNLTHKYAILPIQRRKLHMPKEIESTFRVKKINQDFKYVPQ